MRIGSWRSLAASTTARTLSADITGIQAQAVDPSVNSGQSQLIIKMNIGDNGYGAFLTNSL